MRGKNRKIIEMAAGVTVGNLVLAFAVVAFIVPHGIAMGGATGMGLSIRHYTGLPLSAIILCVNILLFLLGALVLGKKFALSTLLSTFLYPLALSLIQMIPGITRLTDNVMLATLYGGTLLGLGVGLVIRVGASTGGTDILALVINKKTHLSVAVLLYVVDFTVLGVQTLFSSSQQILYGILSLLLTTLVVNRVMLFGKSQIQLFIISEKYDAIRKRVLTEMDAGVTMVRIETGYGQDEQKGVLCVVPNRKLYSINEMIQKIDPKAFITVTQINEVRGRGFSMERYYEGKGVKEEKS